MMTSATPRRRFAATCLSASLSLCLAGASTLGCTPKSSSAEEGESSLAPVELLAAPIPADVGMLFTVRGGGDALSAMSQANVYAPFTSDELAALRSELDELFFTRLGMSLTYVEGVTFFVTSSEAPVLLAHGAQIRELTGEVALEHEGVKILRSAELDGAFITPIRGGVAISFGEAAALRAVIDVERGKAPGLADAKGALRELVEGHEKGNFLLALDFGAFKEDGAPPELAQRGIERGLIYVEEGAMVFVLEGDGEKLKEFAREFEGWIAMGVVGVKSQTSDLDSMELGVAAGMIYAEHQLVALQRVLKPVLEDDRFTVTVPVHGGADPMIMVAVGGIMAAIAIPALTKYMRRAKTSEARVQLARAFDGVAGGLNRTGGMRCPTDGRDAGSIGPTPPLSVNCNLGPGGRCIPGASGPGGYPAALWGDDGVWQQLNFAQDQAHYFHYSYTWANEPGGCQFSVTAFADLDDDGLYSTFERSGASDQSGVNGSAGLFIENDVE